MSPITSKLNQDDSVRNYYIGVFVVKIITKPHSQVLGGEMMKQITYLLFSLAWVARNNKFVSISQHAILIYAMPTFLQYPYCSFD